MDEGSREEIRNRRISTEDLIRLGIQRRMEIRADVTNPNRVLAWSESLEATADLLIPWANDPSDGDKFNQEWRARPCRVVRHGSKLIPHPTASDCRAAERIVMGLLDRQGILVNRRSVSGPTGAKATEPTPGATETATEGQNPVAVAL